MSKIFQVLGGFFHWDATRVHPTLGSILPGQYHPSIVFVEAPNYVFESWGYDEMAEGDARFVQPTPPEGWLYDPNTGTFYPEQINTSPIEYDEVTDMHTALSLLVVEPEEA